MNFVDTHAHAHFDKYGSDAEAMLKRGEKAGVNKVITVGVNVEDSKKAVKFAEKYPAVWASVGNHPHDSNKFLADTQKSIRELEAIAGHPKVVAVGEVGLDYYHQHSDRDAQIRALNIQLDFAFKTGKPVIFHVRDAWEDFWPIYDNFKSLKGVVHSFSAGTKQLRACLDRGLYVALNGIMTFTKDQAQLNAASEIPNEALLLETDAPFLTPAPFRDTVCEVMHVVDTAKFLAELRGQPLKELAETTTNNAIDLFGLN